MKTTIEPTLPGEYLEDFMNGMSRYELAKRSGLTPTQVGQIIAGRRAITALTALKLARVFDTSPELWLNLQTKYDLFVESRRHPELVSA